MNPTLLAITKAVVVVFFNLNLVAAMVYLERKLVGRIQHRVGPNRAGPFGVLQPMADIVKLILKEDVTPRGADRWIYGLAPILAATLAFIGYAPIPFGPPGWQVADINVGLLYMLMVSSLTVYGVMLGGWASNSKYSLLGALRSSAQMISYELGLAGAAVAVVMVSGTLDLREIVDDFQSQGGLGWLPGWNIFSPLLWPSFIVFTISAYAELNRVPFDLPEAEGELGAGFHTEYSSGRFAMFFMAEYASLATMSALAVTLYFGGWSGLGWFDLERLPAWLGWYSYIAPTVIFFTKQMVFMVGAIWVRATLPRMRYDQLMNLGWKVLIPVATANLVALALFEAASQRWF